MKVDLTTGKDLADKANTIQYGLQHNEQRVSWWIKLTDTVKEFCIKIRF